MAVLSETSCRIKKGRAGYADPAGNFSQSALTAPQASHRLDVRERYKYRSRF